LQLKYNASLREAEEFVSHYQSCKINLESKKNSLALNILAVVLLVSALVYLTIRYAPEITTFVSDPHKFRDYVISFGPWSAIAFMGFQILQVVIAIIPGEPIQIAGGYIFGTFLGTVYSTVGITLGYLIVFYMVKWLGSPLVKRFVPEKELEKFSHLLNSPKLEVTIFLLFLIPGIPKDILVYIAGLTPIKSGVFFIIITIARMPAMIGSSYIGEKLQTGEYTLVTIVSVIACIFFVLGYIYKDKIIEYLHHRSPGSRR
jgi:uncharacterized membrane protein YdjX (TVP38/TMEM64 family)